jgi:enoyl-[acyl-carrier-protein] reductase (NADH)
LLLSVYVLPVSKQVDRTVTSFLLYSESAITYSTAEVGNTAAFLVSPLASAVTGSTIYVDNGLNTMGLALDSPTLST